MLALIGRGRAHVQGSWNENQQYHGERRRKAGPQVNAALMQSSARVKRERAGLESAPHKGAVNKTLKYGSERRNDLVHQVAMRYPIDHGS